MTIIHLNCLTTKDIPPERVLNAALEADLETVVVLGVDKDGSRYFASSTADAAENIFLAEHFKLMLLQETGERHE